MEPRRRPRRPLARGGARRGGGGADGAAGGGGARRRHSLRAERGSGWNAIVRPLLARANVTLEGDGAATSSRKTLRFDVPPAELYRITEPETLYVQLPASAVASGHRMLARARARHLRRPRRRHLRRPPRRGEWRGDAAGRRRHQPALPRRRHVAAAPRPAASLARRLRAERRPPRRSRLGAVGARRLAGGRAGRAARQPPPPRRRPHARRDPQFVDYSITAPESISALVPPEAVLSGRRTEFDAALLIRPVAGRARLSGSLLHAPTRRRSARRRRSSSWSRWWATSGRRRWGARRRRPTAPSRARSSTASARRTSRRRRGRRSSARARRRARRRTNDVTVTCRCRRSSTTTSCRPRRSRSTCPPSRCARASPSSRRRGSASSRATAPSSWGLAPRGAHRGDGHARRRRARHPGRLQQDAWVDASAPRAANATAGTAAVGDGAAAMAATSALVAGLQALQGEPRGWNAIVQPALGAAHIRRLGNASLEIALPDARANYSITVPETVVLTVPADALVSGRQVVAPLPLTILPTPGQGLLSNSLVGNNSEADVQGGGSLLTVTLRDDAWEPSVGQRGSGAADSLTQAVLAVRVGAERGLRVERDRAPGAAVHRRLVRRRRVGDARAAAVPSVRPAQVRDDLGQPAGSRRRVGAGGLRRHPPRRRARRAADLGEHGDVLDERHALRQRQRDDLRSELAYTLVVTLTGDSWTRDVGQFDASGEGASTASPRLHLLQSEELGWNAIVRPAAPSGRARHPADRRAHLDTTVTITVDQFAAADITAPETVELVVPQIAVSSAQTVPCKAFLVLPITGSASLGGRPSRRRRRRRSVAPTAPPSRCFASSSSATRGPTTCRRSAPTASPC